MGKSLSEDLRWRIIHCQAEGFTQKEIAKRMYVCEATVSKVCRIFKKWGCVKDPFVGSVGRRKIFTTQDMLVLESLVKDKVDWYLDELVYEMEQRIGKLVSIPTLWRSLRFCGITRKKIQKAAKERSEILRGVYLYNIGMNYTAEQLIFIDESAKDERTFTRLYGYSPINTRAKKSVVFIRGKRYTILPALSLEGFIAVDIMEGSCDKERFQTFVLTQLLSQMNPYPAKHSVLVMDDARIHHNDDLVEAVEDIGGRVLYLPPYSPDLNPIETAFSAMKSWLRRYRDFANYFDPKYLISVALAQTTPEIARKYFKESVYL